MDLRGAALHRIVGLEGLRGTTITPAQSLDLAGLLAEHLGITVRDFG